MIDGDHNYCTVTEELRLIGERAAGAELPLLLFHDVVLAARAAATTTSRPARSPPSTATRWRATAAASSRASPAWRRAACPTRAPRRTRAGSATACSPRSRTSSRPRGGVRLAVVPAFFGFGVAWPRAAPYAEELARRLDPLDRNPVLERLEANRVHHLAERAARAERAVGARASAAARQEALLRRLLDSSAFAVAERLSRLRRRAGIAPGAVGGLQGRDPPRARAPEAAGCRRATTCGAGAG